MQRHPKGLTFRGQRWEIEHFDCLAWLAALHRPHVSSMAQILHGEEKARAANRNKTSNTQMLDDRPCWKNVAKLCKAPNQKNPEDTISR